MDSLMLLLDMLTPWVIWLGWSSLKMSPLLVLCLWLARRADWRLGIAPGIQRFVWLGLLLSLCIPWGWSLPLEIATHAQETLATAAAAPADQPAQLAPLPPAIGQQEASGFASATTEATPPLAPEHWLGGLWLGGCLVLCLLTLAYVLRLYWQLRQAQPLPSRVEELLADCCRELGIHTQPRLRQSAQIHTPCIIYLGSAWIALPAGLHQQLDDQQMRQVLRHELSHWQGRDLLLTWVSWLVCLLHWFNPLVWLAAARLRHTLERACDARVLARLEPGEQQHYGKTLLALSARPANYRLPIPLCVGILEAHQELHQRLIDIHNTLNRKEPHPMNTPQKIASLLLLGCLTTFAFAQPASDKTTSGAAATGLRQEMPLGQFAAALEKNLKEPVLVGQPLAHAAVFVSLDSQQLSYERALTQLKVNGFTAFRTNGFVQIILLREARNSPIPVVQGNERYFADEYVTEHVQLKKTCAEKLLPMLRPMVPQESHLALYDNSRALVFTDAYSNIQRIKKVITQLEQNLNAPEDCSQLKLPERKPNTGTNNKN